MCVESLQNIYSNKKMFLDFCLFVYLTFNTVMVLDNIFLVYVSWNKAIYQIYVTKSQDINDTNYFTDINSQIENIHELYAFQLNINNHYKRFWNQNKRNAKKGKN